MTVQTHYPRLDSSIPSEVQRHLQLIYSKLNNHALAFEQLITNTPSLAGKAGKNGSAPVAAPAAAAAELQAQRAQLAQLARLAQLATANQQLLRQPAITRAYSEVTAAYAIDPTNDFQINCTSGTFTVTLPDATGITGQTFSVKNSGGGTITLTAVPAQTIDGSPSRVLTRWDNAAVMSTGRSWIVVNTGSSM
jgi:hypothetical protein